MQQKTTWIGYLIIGINFVLLSIILSSCSVNDDGSITTHFVYRNSTSQKVEINLFNEQNDNYKNYSINSNQEVLISYKYFGPKRGVGQPFKDAVKIVLKFTFSNRCIVNYPKLMEVKQYDNFTEKS